VLRVAAEHADIVNIAGVYQIKGRSPGTFRLVTAAEAQVGMTLDDMLETPFLLIGTEDVDGQHAHLIAQRMRHSTSVSTG
jgi:hypothetical protein